MNPNRISNAIISKEREAEAKEFLKMIVDDSDADMVSLVYEEDAIEAFAQAGKELLVVPSHRLVTVTLSFVVRANSDDMERTIYDTEYNVPDGDV